MSLARQYVAKVGANLVGLLAGLAMLALAPRFLGPAAFGRYDFLANFFQQASMLLDTGTSTCFYTRLSQRRDDVGLVRFYWRFVLGASAFMVAAAAAIAWSSTGRSVWVGEPPAYVIMATCIGCLVWWQQVARKTIDAYHLTVRGETIYAIVKIVSVVALAAAALTFGLNLAGYFVFQIVVMLVPILLWWQLWHRYGIAPVIAFRAEVGRGQSGDKEMSGKYFKEFWDYSHPLVVFAAVSAVTGVAERWLLQHHAGSVQQGFYALAYQVGAACFLFTGALTQLLMREFAVSWNEGNLERMRSLFVRLIPLLYAVAAYFSVFVAVHAADVAWLFGGADYGAGIQAVAIMALYPMHQTYGQLSGSLFYATGRTALYRNVGVLGMLAGLPLMYVLIASPSAGGLGLGAVGLAVKVVLMQALMVNVFLWFNVRLLSLSYWRFVAHQMVVPLVFGACAGASSMAIGGMLPRAAGFVASGALYSLLVGGAIYAAPVLLGCNRQELRGYAHRIVGTVLGNCS